MADHYQMYINGEWVDALSAETYESFNPYTGEVFARVAAGTRDDARRAIDAAQAAFPAWSQSLPAERQALFLKAADILESKRDEAVRIIAEETGGTFGWAMFQATFTPGLLREAAAQTHQPVGEVIPGNIPGAFNMAVRQPVGVVAGIAPWNAPLILSLRSICLPIAYGNTAILKPSHQSSVIGGVIIAQVFEQAGFPPGVLNLVTNGPGGSGPIGDEFVENPAVKRINVTGSTKTGRIIAEKAGKHLKRVALELGGQNPLLVLKDADIETAVNAATFGGFLHQGQICMSVRRIIVESEVVEQFTDKFVQKAKTLKVGDPKDPHVAIGPVINRDQLEAIKRNVESAVKEGAKILCGGEHEGLCYHPTVLANVTAQMTISCEETFGPVVSILEVDSLEEAVKVANDTPYGLSAGVFTQDLEKGLWVAERIQSGMVHINDSSVHDEPQMPFGGVGDSGYGRLGGRAALEEFTELRWISFQRTPRHYPF